MAHETFKVTSKLKEGLQVEAVARGHQIIMDEPEGLGGTDTGMNPVEVLLTSLGGCMSICASLFASSCGVDLKGFSVDIEGDIDLRGFKGAKNVDPGFQDIRYKLNFETDSPRENIEKLVEMIEDRCPVSDTLQRSINVVRHNG